MKKIIGILIFVVLLMFVGNVITIANQIQMVTNVYCAYAFYVVLFVLLLVFVIIPIIKLLKMPVFSFSKVNNTDYSIEALQGEGQELTFEDLGIEEPNEN